MLYGEEDMRTFEKKPNKHIVQCSTCGLSENHCICSYNIDLSVDVEFWLLTHENEFSRTTNTGRLIENAIKTTKTFKWMRTEPPEELIKLIASDEYEIYLIFSDERENEKVRSVSYKATTKKMAFLILDGTWKEVRKILRKSPYLDSLPILSLNQVPASSYDLRRNKDEDHICTAEVAVELLKIIGNQEASQALNKYYETFLNNYHASQK